MKQVWIVSVLLSVSLNLAAQDDFDTTFDDAGFDDWDVLFEEEAPTGWQALGITGFAESRAGVRLQESELRDRVTLAELRLSLEKQWQWQQGSAKLAADLLYDEPASTQKPDIQDGKGWLDLRQAWVQRRLGSVDVKAGRQLLTWGVGDLLFINDLFGKDWVSFLLGRDEQLLKVPTDAFKLSLFHNAVNADLVYVPRFVSDRYISGERVIYYSPLCGELVGRNQVLDVMRPDKDNAEWSARLYQTKGRFEWALYGYRGFWKSPGGFDLTTGAAIFPRLNVYGASLRGPVGPGLLSVELGYYASIEDSDGSDLAINNSEARLLLGYELSTGDHSSLNMQYYAEALQDYDAYRDNLMAEQSPRDEYRQVVTARYTHQALADRLTLSTMAFYSPTDRDIYLRASTNYEFNDAWSVEAGLGLFSGDDAHTFYAQFEDNSNLYLMARFSF